MHDSEPGPSCLEDKEVRSMRLSGPESGKVRDLEDLDDAYSKQTHNIRVEPPRKLLKLKIKMRTPISAAEGQASAISEEGEAARRPSSLQMIDAASSIKLNTSVPEREQSFQAETASEDLDGRNQGNNLHSGRCQIDLPEATEEVVRRSRSTRMKTTQALNLVRHTFESTDRLRRADNDTLTQERMPSTSRRNRGDRFSEIDLMSSAGCKTNDSVRKVSWLMLVEHEESYQYIPQLGDEVAYLMQVISV